MAVQQNQTDWSSIGTTNTYKIRALSKIWWVLYLIGSVSMICLFIYFLFTAVGGNRFKDMYTLLRLHFWTILILMTASCGTKSTETKREPIEITVVDLLDETKEKNNGEITITETVNKIQFGYNENMGDSIFDYSVTVDMKSDSVLIYDHGNEICTLDGVRNYLIEGGQVTIKRYGYDVAGTFDEEADFFFIDNYGLIAMKFYDGNELFFDRGNSFVETIIEQLRKDDGFYKREIGELPSDYDSVEIEAELDTIE